MSRRTCSVLYCTNNSKNCPKTTSFFTTVQARIKSRWLAANPGGWKDLKLFFVCSDHFKKEDMFTGISGKSHLKDRYQAVPSVFRDSIVSNGTATSTGTLKKKVWNERSVESPSVSNSCSNKIGFTETSGLSSEDFEEDSIKEEVILIESETTGNSTHEETVIEKSLEGYECDIVDVKEEDPLDCTSPDKESVDNINRVKAEEDLEICAESKDCVDIHKGRKRKVTDDFDGDDCAEAIEDPLIKKVIKREERATDYDTKENDIQCYCQSEDIIDLVRDLGKYKNLAAINARLLKRMLLESANQGKEMDKLKAEIEEMKKTLHEIAVDRQNIREEFRKREALLKSQRLEMESMVDIQNHISSQVEETRQLERNNAKTNQLLIPQSQLERNKAVITIKTAGKK